MTLRLGDRVRIDIPDELDPDFELNGDHAIVLDIKHSDPALLKPPVGDRFWWAY